MTFAIILFFTSTYCLIIGNMGAAYLGYGIVSAIVTFILLYRINEVKKLTTKNQNLLLKFAEESYQINPVDILHLLKTKEKEYRNKNSFEKKINFTDFLYLEYIRPQINDIHHTHLKLVSEGYLLPKTTDYSESDVKHTEHQVKQVFFEVFTKLFPDCKEVQAYYLMRQLKLFPRYKHWRANISQNKTVEESVLENIEFKFQKLYKTARSDKTLFLSFLTDKSVSFDFKDELTLKNFNINKNLTIEDNVRAVYDIDKLAKGLKYIYCELREDYSSDSKCRFALKLNLNELLNQKEIIKATELSYFDFMYSENIKLHISLRKSSEAKTSIPPEHDFGVCYVEHKSTYGNDFHTISGSKLDNIKELLPNIDVINL